MFVSIRGANSVDGILSRNLPYYQGLSPENKLRFRKRVHAFIVNKTFRGGNGFKITTEHKVAVAAAAVQISFGNGHFLLDTFHTIIIYPGAYQSTITKNYHRGEVNPTAGTIVLSWDDFIHGYSTDEDNLNVGLHEMAHAYYFQLVIDREEIETSYDFLSKFLFVSEEEIVKIRKNMSSLFRDYAGENVFEFFAVSIEYFFEAGKEFRETLPDMYRQMCMLLNQDSAQNIPVGFDYVEYFGNSIELNHVPSVEKVEYSDRELGMRLGTIRVKIFMRFYAFLFALSVFLLLIHQTGFLMVLASVSGILLFASFHSRYMNSLFITKNYLFIEKRGLASNTLLGISFDNMLAAEIERGTNDLSIKYFCDGYIKSISLSPKSFGVKNGMKKALVKKRVMIKVDGLRIPRIKTHKNGRRR